MCNPPKPTKPLSYPAGNIFKVKTIFDKPKRMMNLAKLDSSEVNSLKTKDPFMYFSIDSVRDAAVHHRSEDVSVFDVTHAEASQGRQQKRNGDPKNKTCIVTRKSRISYEVYPDLFLEDVPDDVPVLMGAGNEECDFYSFVASLQMMKE